MSWSSKDTGQPMCFHRMFHLVAPDLPMAKTTRSQIT
jgi:hypothetical protein